MAKKIISEAAKQKAKQFGQALKNKLKQKKVAEIDKDGREILDPTPLVVETGLKGPSIEDQVREIVQSQAFNQAVNALGEETFEEAMDFSGMEDDLDIPLSEAERMALYSENTSFSEESIVDGSVEKVIGSDSGGSPASSQEGTTGSPAGASAPSDQGSQQPAGS